MSPDIQEAQMAHVAEWQALVTFAEIGIAFMAIWFLVDQGA